MESYTQKWVDKENGFVKREAFVSEDVYKLEIDRLFNRNWIFLGHETEIPDEGDFVVRNLGNAPVIVIRVDKNNIKIFLNSCRHRGTKLCRGDAGKTKKFVCPFHGWTYEKSGKLISTGFDHHFPKKTDFSSLSLISAPRVETFRGMIFGCWDKDVVGLNQFLGDIAWYLDAFFNRSPQGMEVLAPPHRWRTKANWKIGALNFIGDNQHGSTTHIGPSTLDKNRTIREGFRKSAEESFHVVTEGGHGCTMAYLVPGMPKRNYRTYSEKLKPIYEKNLQSGQYAMLRNLRVCVGTVFPNLSFVESQVGPGEKALIVRLWHPVNATEMEVLSWVFAEIEANDEYKESALRNGFHNFGAAGVFEQDDMELWASATAASDNSIAQQYPFSFQTSLRYISKPTKQHDWPGKTYRPVDTEVAQFHFMQHWEKVLLAGGPF